MASSSDAMLYLQDYLDIVEALPHELISNLSQIKELDKEGGDTMTELKASVDEYTGKISQLSDKEKVNQLRMLSQLFKKASSHAEQRVTLASQMYDVVDRYCRRLDDDFLKFEQEQLIGPPGRHTVDEEKKERKTARQTPQKTRKRTYRERDFDTASPPLPSHPAPSHRHSAIAASHPSASVNASAISNSNANDTGSSNNNNNGNNSSGGTTTRNADPIGPPSQTESNPSPPRRDRTINTRIRNTGRKKEDGPVTASSTRSPAALDMPVDPNEPTYCICQQVSYGEMIACDNDDCEIEWFHYNCVGLNGPPRGRWYCPQCTKNMKK